MIAKTIELTNFGRHKHVHFDSQAPMVGILGSNGTGKSTILDALEFAYTGETRDKLDSYVRNFDGNASVIVTFQKDGKEGRIMRQCGKTPKRELVWDGKKMTKSKEVDEMMRTIFGVDKQAVSNAVFISQGSLSGILFDKDANRKLLFIRLVNMAYLDARSNVLDRKIKRLLATVEDLTGAKDLAVQNKEAAEQVLALRYQELSQLKDVSAGIEFCRAMLADQEERGRLEAELGLKQQAMQQAVMEVDGRLSQCDIGIGSPTVEDVANYVNSVAGDNARQHTDLERRRQISNRISQRTSALREELLAGQKVRQLQAELAQANPEKLTAGDISVKISTVEHKVFGARQRNQLQLQIGQIQEALDLLDNQRSTARQDLTNFEAGNPEDGQITLQSEVETLRITTVTLQNHLKERQRMLADGCLTAGESTCGKCGLVISDPESTTPEGIARLQQAANDSYQRWFGKDAELTSMTQQRAKLTAEVWDLQRQIARHEATLKHHQATLGTLPDEGSEEDLSDQRAQLLALQTRSIYLNTGITNATKELATRRQAREQFEDVAQIMTAGQSDDYSGAKIAVLIQEVQAHDQTLQQWQAFLQELQRHEWTRQTAARAVSEMETKLQILQQKIQQAAPPPEVDELDAESNDILDLAQIKVSLETAQGLRQQAVGAHREASDAQQRAGQELENIKRRMAKDEAKLGLIKDLEKVRGLLSNDGLPMAVVRQHFEHLTALTQQALGKLNANFSIDIDREEELSFTFRRLDEENAIDLPMQKLSGGQRVRLCIAFLMAVQKRLVKDVGLLVLDEPSVHVDEEGVENLIELFRELGEAIKSSEMQVIVVDHNPAMRRAFGKVLELS